MRDLSLLEVSHTQLCGTSVGEFPYLQGEKLTLGILIAVFLSFKSLILNFKDSQEHPSLPEHQAVMFVLNTLEPMADKSDFFFLRRCIWYTWNTSLETKYPSSQD